MLLTIHIILWIIVSLKIYKNLMLTNHEKFKLILLAVLLPIIGSILSFSISRGSEFGESPRCSEFYGNSSGSSGGGSSEGGSGSGE